MEYIRLGSAGVKVSRIALGLGFRGQSSVHAAWRLIEHAIDSGVNFIDCANFYRVIGGPLSEDLVSPVLRKRRDEVVVTSKVYGHVGPGPNDGAAPGTTSSRRSRGRSRGSAPTTWTSTCSTSSTMRRRSRRRLGRWTTW